MAAFASLNLICIGKSKNKRSKNCYLFLGYEMIVSKNSEILVKVYYNGLSE